MVIKTHLCYYKCHCDDVDDKKAADTNINTNSIKNFFCVSGSVMEAATAFSMAIQHKNTRPDKTYLSLKKKHKVLQKW